MMMIHHDDLCLCFMIVSGMPDVRRPTEKYFVESFQPGPLSPNK